MKNLSKKKRKIWTSLFGLVLFRILLKNFCIFGFFQADRLSLGAKVLLEIKQKRPQLRAQWETDAKELAWRDNLKTHDIVDIQTWDGVWKLGQILSVGNDKNLVLVIPNGEHQRNLQYFNR